MSKRNYKANIRHCEQREAIHGKSLETLDCRPSLAITKYNGFTLVELSIILVIIGLLIGGTLVAQSMISTSKITALTAQIQQFDSGVMNFKTKYNALPGDAVAFGGDGNNAILSSTGFDGANYYEGRYFAYEICRFWNNIDATAFPGGATCPGGTDTSSSGGARNVPESKLGKSGSFVIAEALTINGYHVPATNVKNYYAILDSSQGKDPVSISWFITTTAQNSAIKPADLLALDKKMDDGIANLGNIISGSLANFGSGYGGIIAGPASGICSDNTGKYLVDHPAYECTPLIRIDAQAGDPQ